MSDLTPKTDAYLPAPYPDDEIDLKELFMVLWGGKWLISAVTGLAAAISVVVALSLPNIYTASALLAPAESSGGGLSGLMKQYGGLASLAGVSLPGGEEETRAQLGMQLMKSRVFIGNFVERHDILPELMAIEGWDWEKDELSFDEDDYLVDSGVWVRDVDPPFKSQPSLLEAHEEFIDILAVSENKKTGYVTVSIDHQSPVIAAQWVNWLVEDVNAAVKAQDVAEAEKSIEYLKQQVANTSLADLQVMFFELIQSQTETVMLAEVRSEYVFKTIDPAVIPEEKSKPSRALICVLGTLLGGMLGVVIVLIRHYARSEPDS
ncbi:Wzz/FepE/Etk N-terminal domain-containing protein [Luminiphilus sp.]|nr:Wzz/FepE/Etk N-terminal domain-containing protein [Luminiphilus sp.]